MTLESADYDRIQQLIKEATAPLVGQFSAFTASYLTLREYEKEHDHVVKDVIANKDDLRNLRQWAYNEHKELQVDNDKIKEDVEKKHKEVMDALGDLKGDISNNRLVTLRYIVSVIISFLIGGVSLIGLLNAFHVLH